MRVVQHLGLLRSPDPDAAARSLLGPAESAASAGPPITGRRRPRYGRAWAAINRLGVLPFKIAFVIGTCGCAGPASAVQGCPNERPCLIGRRRQPVRPACKTR